MSASPAFNVDRVKDGVDRVQATVLAETDKAIIYIENLDLNSQQGSVWHDALIVRWIRAAKSGSPDTLYEVMIETAATEPLIAATGPRSIQRVFLAALERVEANCQA